MSRRKRNFWSRAKPLVIPQGGRPLSYEKKVLEARNEYWKAGAVWERIDGHWRCTSADQVMGWMRKLTPESAKLELARRGCQWEWR